MNSREKIKRILNHEPDAKVGYWTGSPHEDTLKIYLSKMNFAAREDLFRYLKDDCRWVIADFGYQHPEDKLMFDVLNGQERVSLSQPGCFAECSSLTQIEAHPWPDVKYLDFTSVINEIRQYSDKMVFTGMWSPFFHIVADYFGMENYFLKMYTDPVIVEAVTDHVVQFLVEANTLFFEALGDDADVFFFGNDFGSQEDLLVSPESFKKFVLPGFQKLIDVAKSYRKKVLLHSCGAIAKAIPMLIDAGIDALHPLQAKAKGMDAETLARDFKGDITFVGGVDTQELLVHATPQGIKDEIQRLKDALGPHFIVSPSHECILPNVPLENVIAMAETAHEQ